MKIISNVHELQSEIQKIQKRGKTIGFVPTMGALHAGHKSLVARSVGENDFNVVSIFVNPTQFNSLSDLEKYPRNIERDAEMLGAIGCDLIFAPQPEDIYTEDELTGHFDFDFAGLDKVMEGKFRPGHFNGVVQVVSKLFNFVQPDKAYFGEKDFQQLAIIHYMVKALNINVEIIDCPIVREESGLAMSSRNERLTPDQRKYAAEISKVLFESRNFVPDLSPADLTVWVSGRINAIEGLKVEYFEIVDSKNLRTIQTWEKPAVGCIAVFCGEVRLIDNVRFESMTN